MYGRNAYQFSSVTQSCLSLCDSVDCSIPSLPVHHQLPELAQNHVHWISDVIQPSHPLQPLFLLPSVFLSIRLFSSESLFCIRWPKYWSFSFSISPSKNIQDWFPLGLIGWISLLLDSQESSPTPQFKGINSLVLSFLYSATLTSIHDHRKKRSLH